VCGGGENELKAEKKFFRSVFYSFLLFVSPFFHFDFMSEKRIRMVMTTGSTFHKNHQAQVENGRKTLSSQ
jgi:hypothetical protein